MIRFIGTFIGMGISGAPPYPTDWSVGAVGYFLSKYATASLAWTTVETMILDYADKMLTGKLKEAFSTNRNEYGAFPAGYHLCFPTTGGYAPLMNEARNGGVSVCRRCIGR
jgi:hypothetical protein